MRNLRNRTSARRGDILSDAIRFSIACCTTNRSEKAEIFYQTVVSHYRAK
jgi:hypothetical protein